MNSEAFERTDEEAFEISDCKGVCFCCVFAIRCMDSPGIVDCEAFERTDAEAFTGAVQVSDCKGRVVVLWL